MFFHRITRLLCIVILINFFALPQSLSADPQSDFNDDSFADLAIGVPYENVSSITDAGSVSVLYGTWDGLSFIGNEYWVQDYLDGSNAEIYEYFGRSLAAGDFNGDGFYDLAVGVSHEDVGSVNQAGAVNIIYGSPTGGLDVSGNQYWHQDVTYIEGACEIDDHFGYSLAAGNFNGDAYDDLAIGVPDEDIGTVVDAGAVNILYGTAAGLTSSSDQIWDQGGGVEIGDQFGKTLASGDFNNDGYDDLVIGISGEDLGSITNSGAVEILYGSFSGLTTRVNNDFWHQDRSGIADTADEHDFFGSALCTGDFNGDSYDDLVVGIPYEDIGSPVITNTGAINILYGSESGITGIGSEYWHQDTAGIGSLSEENDRFGFSLASGDLDGDGRDDLAVGVPYEDWNLADTGIVQVFYGADTGLSTISDQLFRQDITGIQDVEEASDRYGYSLAASDFNGDFFDDLAIGIPYEAIGTTTQAGAVNIIYGGTYGLTTIGNQFWYQGGSGLQGTVEAGDRFGFSLAAIPLPHFTVHLPIVLKNFSH